MCASTSGGSEVRSQPDDGEPLARFIRDKPDRQPFDLGHLPLELAQQRPALRPGVTSGGDQVMVELDGLVFELPTQVVDRQRGHVAAPTAGREVDLDGGETQAAVKSSRLRRRPQPQEGSGAAHGGADPVHAVKPPTKHHDGQRDDRNPGDEEGSDPDQQLPHGRKATDVRA